MSSAAAASSVVHLNVADFQAAVAIAKDRSLADRPFVIAGTSGARAAVLGLSERAREAGLAAGMSLASAERLVPGLAVVPPDPASCALADAEMGRIAARYSPLVQNDSGGHLYLDLAGTGRLFGAPIDCAVRLRNDIVSSLGIEPAAAVGRNKLVAKVAARSIRPAGIACIRAGDEAGYLATQDAFLLPGVGPAISRVLSVAGIREIGQLASLTDAEALSLFGRRALALRNAALGLDPSAVASGDLGQRAILRSVEFEADALESRSIRAALVTAVEDAGLELRGALLAARRLRLVVRYADGCAAEADERSRAALFLDSDLIAAADEAYATAAVRRVRLRGFAIALSDLAPARREPDLFVPDGPTRLERLQAAVDGSRLRYGASAVTRACALMGRAHAF